MQAEKDVMKVPPHLNDDSNIQPNVCCHVEVVKKRIQSRVGVLGEDLAERTFRTPRQKGEWVSALNDMERSRLSSTQKVLACYRRYAQNHMAADHGVMPAEHIEQLVPAESRDRLRIVLRSHAGRGWSAKFREQPTLSANHWSHQQVPKSGTEYGGPPEVLKVGTTCIRQTPHPVRKQSFSLSSIDLRARLLSPSACCPLVGGNQRLGGWCCWLLRVKERVRWEAGVRAASC
jgi:hypothetical protein